MPVPTQIKYRLIHYKKQILLLAASKVLSVIAICQLMAISRNTFYKYRQQEQTGSLGSFNCAPHHHGRAKSEDVVEKVLAARKLFPHYGKRRLAGYLCAKGTKICANTCQKILCAHNQALPAENRHQKHWRSFEAIKPNTIWSIDICYLYTKKKDGFDLYLITILDDHSRFVVGSALFPQQTVVEVVGVLKQATLSYGVPQLLVCDNGVQFTCSEFRRVCKAIALEIDFAPKHYPQYKGKLERFFRTTRKESQRAVNIESALLYHDQWIKDYNFNRVHSAVLDSNRHQHAPSFRFFWKNSAAHLLPDKLNLDATFTVHNSIGAITRAIKADLSISYNKQRLIFPQLNKGDIIIIKELKDSTDFFFQDQLLLSRPIFSLKSTTTRKVKRDGSVLVNRSRFPLNLPKDSLVLISQKDDSFLFFFNGCQIFPILGQENVQQPI